MRSVRGVISAVQEGRFRFVTDDGRIMPFVLSHKAGAEPQDLPPLQAAAARIRVDYEDSGHLIAVIADDVEIEE
jgi:hypothetical protein